MKKEDKSTIIEQIKELLQQYPHFYLMDIGGLDAETTSALRRKCFENKVKLVVVKNKLLHKAFEASETDFSPLYDTLKSNTALMLTETGNAPAKLVKEFLKGNKNPEAKPLLKAAYVEETMFVGAQQLDTLASLKSKNELIADIIALLQSPAKNVVSALQSGGTKLHGVLQTLSERPE